MKEIYQFSGTDFGDLLGTFGALVRREFFDGELRANVREQFSMTVEKAISHPITLIRVVSNSTVSYRRGWDHIRSNRSGVRVIRFVRRGHVEFVRSSGNITINSGECTILDSSIPFHVKSVTDGELFEMVLAIVPAHLFIRYLPFVSNFEDLVVFNYEDHKVFEKILNYLCDLDDNISAKMAGLLSDAFLESFSEVIKDINPHILYSDRQLIRELSYIRDKISDNLQYSSLDGNKMASLCGISMRKIYYILESEGTTLSKEIWRMRLERARDLITSIDMAHIDIREIAFKVGFKDASHFSRSFKEAFGKSPKQFRKDAIAVGHIDTIQPTLDMARL